MSDLAAAVEAFLADSILPAVIAQGATGIRAAVPGVTAVRLAGAGPASHRGRWTSAARHSGFLTPR